MYKLWGKNTLRDYSNGIKYCINDYGNTIFFIIPEYYSDEIFDNIINYYYKHIKDEIHFFVNTFDSEFIIKVMKHGFFIRCIKEYICPDGILYCNKPRGKYNVKYLLYLSLSKKYPVINYNKLHIHKSVVRLLNKYKLLIDTDFNKINKKSPPQSGGVLKISP
jgi:hypothetical protein